MPLLPPIVFRMLKRIAPLKNRRTNQKVKMHTHTHKKLLNNKPAQSVFNCSCSIHSQHHRHFVIANKFEFLIWLGRSYLCMQLRRVHGICMKIVNTISNERMTLNEVKLKRTKAAHGTHKEYCRAFGDNLH